MELLVVIGILVTLMGLLFPAIGMVRENAKRGRTSAAMAQIAAACETYRLARGTYPSAAGWAGQVLAVAQDIPGAVGGEIRDAWESPFLYIDTRNYDHQGTWNAIDAAAWQTIQQAFPANGAPKPIPKPDSFWLWSRGANLKNDPADWSDPAGAGTTTLPMGGGDDIAHWNG